MSRVISKITYNVFWVLIIWLLLAALAFVMSQFSFPLSIILLAGTLVVLFVCLYFGNDIYNKVSSTLYPCVEKLSAKRMAIILFIVVAITKIFFVVLLHMDSSLHGDWKNYINIATEIANKGVIIDGRVAATTYPYEAIYGLFLAPVVKLFGNDSRVLTAFISLLFAVATVMMFDIIKKYLGKNKAFVGLLIFNLLPTGLFQTQILTHENALLIFYIFSFWLLYKAMNLENKSIFIKIGLIIASALLISFGAQINTGGIVFIISYLIYFIVMLFKSEEKKRVIKCFSVVLCYTLCFVIITSVCNLYLENAVQNRIRNNLKTVPLGWIIYLGTNYETSGGWDQKDFDTWQKYLEFKDPDESLEYQKNLIKERVQFFIDNPALIVPHLFKKTIKFWGTPLLPFAYRIGNDISEFIYSGCGGIIYLVIKLIAQYFLIFNFFIIILSRRKKKNRHYTYTPCLQFQLAIVGITIALIPFEAQTKYVSHLHLVLFCVVLFSIKDFCSNSLSFKNEIKRKINWLKTKKTSH